MERRLEHADEPRLRQRLSELADSLKIRRVVRRGDKEIFAHRVKHLVRQLVYAVIALGKHGLEADGFDVPRLFWHRALALGHRAEEHGDAVGVVRDAAAFTLFGIAVLRITVGIDGVGAAADALDLRFAQLPRLRHFKQLEFQGCAPHIAHEYIHAFLLIFVN